MSNPYDVLCKNCGHEKYYHSTYAGLGRCRYVSLITARTCDCENFREKRSRRRKK